MDYAAVLPEYAPKLVTQKHTHNTIIFFSQLGQPLWCSAAINAIIHASTSRAAINRVTMCRTMREEPQFAIIFFPQRFENGATPAWLRIALEAMQTSVIARFFF